MTAQDNGFKRRCSSRGNGSLETVALQNATVAQTVVRDTPVLGISGAAVRLGLKRTTLLAKMKKLGISRPVRQNDVAPLGEEPGIQPFGEKSPN